MSCPVEVGETVGSAGAVKIGDGMVDGAEAIEIAAGGVELDCDSVEVVLADGGEPDCE